MFIRVAIQTVSSIILEFEGFVTIQSVYTLMLTCKFKPDIVVIKLNFNRIYFPICRDITLSTIDHKSCSVGGCLCLNIKYNDQGNDCNGQIALKFF